MMNGKGGGASVARCPPNRWFPLLLPGGVRTALFWCNVRPLGLQLRRNRECFVIVGTCVMGRCGGPIPSENSAFQHTSILVRPHQLSRSVGTLGSHRRITSMDALTRVSPLRRKWWSRRVPPPGPLRLFYAALYRHSRVEPDICRYRQVAADVKGSSAACPAGVARHAPRLSYTPRPRYALTRSFACSRRRNFRGTFAPALARRRDRSWPHLSLTFRAWRTARSARVQLRFVMGRPYCPWI